MPATTTPLIFSVIWQSSNFASNGENGEERGGENADDRGKLVFDRGKLESSWLPPGTVIINVNSGIKIIIVKYSITTYIAT